jgi:hypothetical protein
MQKDKGRKCNLGGVYGSRCKVEAGSEIYLELGSKMEIWWS